MANQFVNLPTTVGNGIGASVDVHSFGATKTIVCQGNADATLNVEFNNDVTPNGTWAPVATFQGTGQITLNIAARWMRVRTSNYNTDMGGTTQIDMGGTDDGTTFASLPVPATTGVGAPVNVSALPLYKTVQVGDPFRGALIVEVSEDGSEWAQPFSFQTPGSQSQVIAAQWMRVRRVGVPMIAPGTPLVNVGATSAAGGAGDQGVAISAGTSSQATGTVVFSNSNGISFGMNNGTVTGSVGAGGIGLGAGTQTAVTGTIVLSNSNGITFGMSNSSVITASVSTQPGTPFALGAGTQSVSTGTVAFANSNGLTFGMAGSNQITASQDGARAIVAGTQTATSGTVVFADSNGISFGMAGSSQITASRGVTSMSQAVIGGMDLRFSATTYGQSIIYVKTALPFNISVTQALQDLVISQASNSTGAISLSVGVYTINHSTANLLASGSRSLSWTSGSGTSGNQYGALSNGQWRSIPLVVNITPGDYLFAYWYSFANATSITVAGFAMGSAGILGDFDGVAASQWLPGFSASTTGAMPATIAVTDTNYVRTGNIAFGLPGLMLSGSF